MSECLFESPFKVGLQLAYECIYVQIPRLFSFPWDCGLALSLDIFITSKGG